MPPISSASSTPLPPQTRADHADAAQALLDDWLAQSESDDTYSRRADIAQALKLARTLSGTDPIVDLDLEDDGPLELPSADALRRAGVQTPRLRLTVDFGEPIGLEALEASLNALGVEQLAIERLASGQLPPGTRLDSVRDLDLSQARGRIDVSRLAAQLAEWPALQAISLPSGQRPRQVPPGWYYDHQRRLCRENASPSASELAAFGTPRAPGPVPPMAHPGGARSFTVPALAENLDDLAPDSGSSLPPSVEAALAALSSSEIEPQDEATHHLPPQARIEAYFRNMSLLLRHNMAIDASLRGRHEQRLGAVQAELARQPALNEAVCDLLAQQSGSCVDAGLRRLDDIDMLLCCGRLASIDDAGPAALRIALLRRADQLQAVGNRKDSENIEKANALRVLIDQRLNALLGTEMPVASAPVYGLLAGLHGVRPGQTPGQDQWSREMREAADQVLLDELNEDFPSLRLLLAEEEGAGALITGLLVRDPGYQVDAARLEADFQRDFEAAQDARPDDPMAGIELHATKEQALAQRRLALLAPWTRRFADAVTGAAAER